MTGRIRKTHSTAFKAKVALEAAKGAKTVAQICSEFGVVTSCVMNWKKQLLDGVPGIFEGKKVVSKSQDELLDPLLREIGRLQVENGYLKKKCLS
jgi:putative transposase